MFLKKRIAEIEKADLTEVKGMLDKIKVNCQELKDNQYALLNNLNALSKSYPNIYNQIKLTVKLPEDNETKDIIQLEDDMNLIIDKYLSDDGFLSSLLNTPDNTLDNTLDKPLNNPLDNSEDSQENNIPDNQ